MAVIAQWQGKTWEVSQRKLAAIEGFTTTYRLNTETNEDAEGYPPTNVRRMELQTLAMETFVSMSTGTGVAQEIASWEALIGASGPLLIGGMRFGPERFRLTDLSVNDVIIDDMGRMAAARLSFSFTEDADEPYKGKPVVPASSGSTAPGVSSGKTTTGTGVGASTAEKATRKVFNNNLRG